MAATSQGPQLTLRTFPSDRSKKPQVVQCRMASRACQWVTTKHRRRWAPWFGADWWKYDWDGGQWVLPRRCCLTVRVDITTYPESGTKEKWEAPKRHWHVFKGKVPRLSAMMLEFDNCSRSRMDFRHWFLSWQVVVYFSGCHPIELSVSKGEM